MLLLCSSARTTTTAAAQQQLLRAWLLVSRLFPVQYYSKGDELLAAAHLQSIMQVLRMEEPAGVPYGERFELRGKRSTA